MFDRYVKRLFLDGQFESIFIAASGAAVPVYAGQEISVP
jgi:hypothetical protein